MKLSNRPERGRLRSREVLGFEPKETAPLDPTPEDRSRIRQYIETQELNGTNMIWTFGALFPDQVGSLKAKGHFFPSNASDAEVAAEDLTVLKLFRPDKFKQEDYKKTTLREDLRVALDSKRQMYPVDQWGNWASVAILFKTLFPEDRTPLLSAEQLAEFRQELAWEDHTRRQGNLWVLANFKLLFPGEFSDLQLDDDDWREIRAEINKIRGEMSTDWTAPYNLTFVLFSAKILAAEHAEIDSQGNVVITPPARHLSTPQPLPPRDMSA